MSNKEIQYTFLNFSNTNIFIQKEPIVNRLEFLVISRDNIKKNSIIVFDDYNNLPDFKITRTIHALLGSIRILNSYYLVIVTDSVVVCDINGRKIYLITDIELLELNDLNSEKVDEIELFKKNIINEYLSGFYYSYDFDMTNNFQSHQFLEIKSLKFNKEVRRQFNTHFDSSNKSYLWNNCLIDNFLTKDVNKKVSSSVDFLRMNSSCIEKYGSIDQSNELIDQCFKWIPYLIYGSVVEKTFFNEQNGKNYNYIIIARRSTSYVTKAVSNQGLDKYSKVSNFIEIEQILIKNDTNFLVASSLSLISSTPIAYNLITKRDKENCYSTTKYSFEISREFEILIDNLSKKFGDIFMINCINSESTQEKLLCKALEDVVKNSQCTQFKYFSVNYDSLSKFQDENYKLESFLLRKLSSIAEYFNYYLVDSRLFEVNEKQNGIFYTTNCTFDLRQEKIHTILAFKSFNYLLYACDIASDKTSIDTLDINNLNEQPLIDMIPNRLTKFKSEFRSTPSLLEIFKDLWKKTFKKLKNQFNNETHEPNKSNLPCINKYDLALVRQQKIALPISKENKNVIGFLSGEIKSLTLDEYKSIIYKRINDYSMKFCKSQNLRVFINTFNCNTEYPNGKDNYKGLLAPLVNLSKESLPDILMFGFQEIINLKPVNVIFDSGDNVLEIWKKYLKSEIKESIEKENYTCIYSNKLVGLLLIIFVKESISHNVKFKDADIIKLGFGGVFGNKGGILFRFNYMLTSIAFACCHLEAGSNKRQERTQQIELLVSKELKSKNIYNKIESHDDYVLANIHSNNYLQKLSDHDVLFLFGDLNYRVEHKFEDAMDLIMSNNINQLLAEDQLNKYGYTKNLNEGEITFPPTYKFAKGTSVYTEKKMRTPSWCDRILYKANQSIDNQIKVVDYNYISNVVVSDHKPVYGIYDIKVFEENSLIDNYLFDLRKEKMNYILSVKEKTFEVFEDSELSIHYKLIK